MSNYKIKMLIPWRERFIGSLLYLFPWSQALPFGNALFNQYPPLKILIIPTLPILYTEQFLPFGSLLLFIILFVGIARNPSIPYFIRFNTLQGLLLNITILIITYGFQIFIAPFASESLRISFSSCILVLILSIIIFSIYECLQGKEADLPIISNAVRVQI